MDWTTVLTAFFAVLPPSLVALGALIAAVRAGRKVDELHSTVDGRMTELLAAQGEKRGRAAERKDVG